MARLQVRLVVLAFALLVSLAAVPVLATVSGEDGRIAFVSDVDGDSDIYTVNPDGSGVVQVTNAPDQNGFPVMDEHPAWSPDGQSIAFTRTVTTPGIPDPTEERTTWIMAADGSDQQMLVDGVEPAWSPDGRSIAFNMGSTGVINGLPTSVIAVVDLGTGDVTILTDPGDWVSMGGFSTSTDYSPTWAPDGEDIVFLRRRAPASPMSSHRDLMAVDVSSRITRSLMPDGETFGYWANGIDISPDSSQVVAAYKPSIAASPDLYVYDIDLGSGSTVDVPEGYGIASWASFAPSGGRLVVALAKPLDLDAGGSIWTMGVDGSDPIEVVLGSNPVWQPLNPYPIGLVDPMSGVWHLRYVDGRVDSFYFGNPGDVPFMGDWDCDGTDTPGLYRQSDGFVYLRNSNTQGVADVRFFFGNPGDVPLAGDFNGGGCDTVSVYRPSNATFYIINEIGADGGGLGAAEMAYIFGNPGDKPFIGDFDGDGIDTPGLHRESTGLVYYRNWNSEGVADAIFLFGNPGDRLVANDWNSDTIDSPAVFRPSATMAFFRFTNTTGNADARFMFGEPEWLPVTGTFELP